MFGSDGKDGEPEKILDNKSDDNPDLKKPDVPKANTS